MSTKGKLTPKLRFPEFAKEPHRDVRLQDVTAECTTRNGDELFFSESVMGVSKVDGMLPMQARLIGSDLARYKLVRKNWFAYNPMRLNIGSIARWKNDSDVLVSPDYVVFRCSEEPDSGIDPEYLDQFRRSEQWEEFVTESGDGSVRVRIYYKDISRIPLRLPPPAEQQKIAHCLSSLDQLIAAEGRKLESLRAYKKGLMQQLFPRDGETMPRLRFPEFRGKGEWTLKPLGELLSRSPEYGLNAAAVQYSPHLPTYIRITDIDDDGQFIHDGRASVAVEASEDNYLADGDIVLARTGASVGKSYRYRVDDGRLVFAGFLIRVRPDATRLDSRLLSSFLSTQTYWDWVRVTSARSGQPGINGTEYAGLLVPLPPYDGDDGTAEQQRIADCLSSLDEQIAAQSRRIESLKQHKKGLMQQLFPTAEEAEA